MANLFVYSLLLVIAASTYASAIQSKSYVVSVTGTDGNVVGYGALIAENFVLTTAQPLAFYDPAQLVVTVNGVQQIPIAAHSFDPKFDFVTMENNVGLLKLAEPVQADYIQLANAQPANGGSAVVYSLNASSDLLSVPISLLSTKVCASDEYGWSADEIFNTMVCGLLKNNDSCVPRYGSPVVSNDKLVGLTSWGGCGNNGKAAVFTDVVSLLSWINQTKQNLE